MLNIVVPMAGLGSRFAQVGFERPKPLISVRGRPMIQQVIENVRPVEDHRFIFVVLDEHRGKFALDQELTTMAPGCTVVSVPELTGGAAMTVLAARHLIDAPEPLLIANSDQMVLPDNRAFISHSLSSGLDGVILTMPADDPKWSFVGLDATGLVTRVVEKEVISNIATVGIYYFALGQDFVRAADAMIAAGDEVNGEYYVAPVYNYQIAAGGKVGTFDAGSEGKTVWGLGTPADLYRFLEFAPPTP